MKNINNSDILVRAYEFEKLCANIFADKGLKVLRNATLNNSKGRRTEIDLILTNNNGREAAAEIKFYRTRKPSRSMLVTGIMRLKEAVKESNITNLMLIVGMPLDEELKLNLKKEYNVHIIDSNNLLYLIRNNQSLEEQLNNLIDDILGTIQIESKPSPLDLNELFSDKTKKSNQRILNLVNKGELLWKELEKIEPGNESYSDYENKCEEILRYIFEENLNGWNRQLRTDDDLNRYDLICRVKRGNEFWEFLIDEFHSRYILFEFKNYSGKIKQNQIHTTEKYLFQKALRNVCFLISRQGMDANATATTKGILRESGKFIINIPDSKLYRLLQLKDAGDEPADYLFELVDEILLKLSK